MKVLGIGAHPDDIEIFMFGILKELKDRGNKIFLGIATDGKLGGENIKNIVEKRSEETIRGLQELGTPIFFNFPDGNLGSELSHYHLIKEYIYKILPDIIITHYKKDYHSDHRNLSEIIKKIAGHNIPLLYCDTMLGLNFNPNYYIDITKNFLLKKKAIKCHFSQKPKRFIDLIKVMNGFRAAQCNAPIGNFVEAYRFDKSFPFHDIRELLPSCPPIRKFDINDQKGFL